MRGGQSAGDLHWIERDGHAILVVGSALGGIKLMRFDGHELEEIASTGTGILKVIVWVLLPQLASLVLTVLFAFLVALVLRGARVTEYRSDLGGDAEIASLLRRIVARLIDTALGPAHGPAPRRTGPGAARRRAGPLLRADRPVLRARLAGLTLLSRLLPTALHLAPCTRSPWPEFHAACHLFPEAADQ